MRTSIVISRDHIDMPKQEDPRSLSLTFESGGGVGPLIFQAVFRTPPPSLFFFLNDPPPPEFSPLPHHAALPIWGGPGGGKRAAKQKMPMSPPLSPETSAPLLAVTPTCHYLEYVDWASAIVEEPLRTVGGEAVIPDRPGTGLAWDEKAVKRYEIA